MSAAAAAASVLHPPPPPLTPSNHAKTSFFQKLTSIGFGYAIAIALGFLFLFSTVLLTSYMCCRSAAVRRRRNLQGTSSSPESPNGNSVYVPRGFFLSEDDDDNSSQNAVVGLDQAVINSYPRFLFSKSNRISDSDTMCAICLCEYKEPEMLRMLPDCKHYFHVKCVDVWLKLNSSCPVCRNSPLPTPLSTPLQEVVPLSQYSDGRRRT